MDSGLGTQADLQDYRVSDAGGAQRLLNPVTGSPGPPAGPTFGDCGCPRAPLTPGGAAAAAPSIIVVP